MMNEMSGQDAALLDTLGHCEHLAWLGVTALPAEPFGVALSMRNRVVGIWSYYQGQYRYRSLASWQPIATVATLDMAVELTEWMADLDAWVGVPAVRGRLH